MGLQPEYSAVVEQVKISCGESRVLLEIFNEGRLATALSPLRKEIARFLTHHPPKSAFRSTQRSARWLSPDDEFPIGLVPELVEWLREKQIVAEVVTKPLLAHAPSIIPLRPYQEEAMRAIFEHGIGIVKLPTSSGKTRLAAAFFETLRRIKPDAQCLFVVSDTGFIYQTRDAFREFIPEDQIGLFWECEKTADRPILIASVDSLQAHLGTYKSQIKPYAMVVDECHLFGATGACYTLQRIRARYRIGLSATPFIRGQEMRNSRIRANLGNVLYTLTVDELVEAGYIMRPRIYLLPRIAMGEEQRSSIDSFVRKNATRNEMVALTAAYLVQQGLRVMVAVNTTEQMKDVTAFIPADIPCTQVFGAVKGEERREAYKVFGAGGPGVLIGTVLGIGVDIPETNVMLVADGGNTDHTAVQRLGRVLRKKNSRVAFMVDFDDIYWGNRSRIFKEEGWEITDLRGNKITSCLKFLGHEIEKMRAA